MKKNLILKIGMFFLLGILMISFTSSIGEVSFCCERLKNTDGTAGAWCQDTNDITECYVGTKDLLTGDKYLAIQTYCESSGYCKLGTCIDSNQGVCQPNTPKQKCVQELGGYWKQQIPEEIPECKSGCCVLQEESMISTQTRCSTEASFRGLEPIFQKNIQDPVQCAMLSNLEEKGACVFEQNFQTKCLALEKKQCQKIMASQASLEIFENYYGNQRSLEGIEASTAKFHAGFLCSAPSLGTICGPRGGTIKSNGKVYFLDTCKNRANIYDYDKIGEDDKYWTFMEEGNEICQLTWNKNTIINANICGNCDMSSIAVFNTGKAKEGNYICQTKDCIDEKDFGVKDFKNKYGRYPFDGESWCVENNQLTKFELTEEWGVNNISAINLKTQNLPGTQYYKIICQNGEVLKPELCMPRADVCAETTINSGKKDSAGKIIKLKQAICAANKYEDCTSQTNKKDCEESSLRDCNWILGFSLQKDEETGESIVYEDKDEDDEKDNNEKFASCVPKIPPATEQLCELASDFCVVKYEKRGFGNVKQTSKCVENCYCIPGFTIDKLDTAPKRKFLDSNPPFLTYAQWVNSMDNTCTHLGDCGDKKNYLGYSGENKGKVVDVSEINKI